MPISDSVPPKKPTEDRAGRRVQEWPRNRCDDDLDDDHEHVDDGREAAPAGDMLAHALEPDRLLGIAGDQQIDDAVAST